MRNLLLKMEKLMLIELSIKYVNRYFQWIMNIWENIFIEKDHLTMFMQN